MVEVMVCLIGASEFVFHTFEISFFVFAILYLNFAFWDFTYSAQGPDIRWWHTFVFVHLLFVFVNLHLVFVLLYLYFLYLC